MKSSKGESIPPQISRKEKIMQFIYHELFIIIAGVVILSLIIGGIIYYEVHSSRVYIEKAEINSPIITLNSLSPGILDQIFVKEGDLVPINTVVAQVDGKPISTKTAGIVTYVKNTPGQYVTPQDSIVQMVDPSKFQIIGHIDEDKGLDSIQPGQKVIFTVDAFGSKEYEGIVSLVSPTSRTSDVIFSISDKREEKQFDIKATFDVTKYPELKNGMSARMWVYL